MPTPLERAREMAAARLADDAARAAARTAANGATTNGAATNGAVAAATVAFESPKLKLAVDVLEKRCDDFANVLENLISDIEASALEPRLSSWFAYFAERRRERVVTVALAGMKMRERTARFCNVAPDDLGDATIAMIGSDAPGAFDRTHGTHLTPRAASPGIEGVAIVRPELTLTDSVLLGTMRRECAGLIWIAPSSALPPEYIDTFAETPLGIVALMPASDDLDAYFTRGVPSGSLAALHAIVSARQALDIAAGIQYEHACETERLAIQAAIAERLKNSRTLSAELASRRDLMAQVREDVARDVQAVVDELVRAIGTLDAETALRLPVRSALEAIPALRASRGRLVHVHDFEIEDRHQWFTGTRWERYAGMFPQKMRLSLPSHDLAKLSETLSTQLVAMISKQATRRIDALDRALADFNLTTAELGIDLEGAKVRDEERILFDRKADARQMRGMPSMTAGTANAPLIERARRTIDASCEKDLKSFHIDLERKGPIGRLMEARTAVIGISFLVMTTIRVSSAFTNYQSSLKPNVASTTAVASGIPWGLIFNATILAVFFMFLGLLVNAITEEGKEGAVVSEKIADTREAIEDKLVAVMERYVASELGAVKALLIEHKAAALDRIDRAIDGKKQELEELDRRTRGAGAPRAGARSAPAPLPTSFKGEIDKTSAALKDVRIEFAARLAATAAERT